MLEPASGPPADTLPSGPARQLLAFAEDRTIWLEPRAEGPAVVRKVFERGTMAQAQAEASLGARLFGEGFVRYLGAEEDPATGRPSTVTEHIPLPDLARWLAAYGPLTPRAVAALGVELCRVLARIHRVAVHRDVKPSNVLLQIDGNDKVAHVTLLDAEHVWWSVGGSVHGAAFTGGTHGWSPPEAYTGATPTPAFDVYGLGTTLWCAATGWPPLRHGFTSAQRVPRRRDLAGMPHELAAVLLACTARGTAARMTLADVATALHTFLAVEPTATALLLDQAHRALFAADLAGAEGTLAHAALSALPSSDPLAQRRDALLLACRRRRRLLVRRPLPSDLLAHAGATLGDVSVRARALHAFARRFPAQQAISTAIARARAQAATALEAVPQAVAGHKRAAAFSAASELLVTAQRVVRDLAPLGGPAPALLGTGAPTAWQRTPARVLQLAGDDLAAARAQHDGLLAALTRAEADLDVSAAGQAIDHAASVYGGASAVVADLKDRLHRLTFFVERLAQPADVLAPLAQELAGDVAADLSTVAHCFEHCRSQRVGNQAPKSALGLRTLLRTLHELAEELPATASRLAPPIAALAGALRQVSLRAWALLDDGRGKLASVPIPVRPLQNLIARLDHLRLLDALIDTPRGARADLLDELERLRSDVDQARTTRDRIASGARAALERGHLTTALYDMARAVDRYDAPASELEEARKRKTAVEDAQRENHRLAARYAELEDDPDSALAQRLHVLEQRRDVLRFLAVQVAAERATTYAQDQLDVEVRMLQERTAEAERQLDTGAQPEARLALTAATLAAIDDFARNLGDEREHPARVQRMREHWGSLHARALADVDREAQARREGWRRRRRSFLVRGIVAALATALAVAIFLLLRPQSPDALRNAASSIGDQLLVPVRQATFDPLPAVLALERFAVGLEGSGLARADLPGAHELVRATRALADHASTTARTDGFDWARWASSMTAARDAFERASNEFAAGTSREAEVVRAGLTRFAQAAELSAVLLAARAVKSDGDRARLRKYARARGLDVELER